MSNLDLKVINLGLPKSGTTTLGVALGHAGMKVADWRFRQHQTDNPKLAGGFVAEIMYRDYFETGNPLFHMDEFDAFTEINLISKGNNLWPQMDWGLLEAIQFHYPHSKFILSYRDPAKLSDSMGRWSNMGTRRLPQNAIPGLPVGYGGNDPDRIRWIEGHHRFCRKVFEGATNFLEYDITDPAAKDKISDFLGVDLPWWGKANENLNSVAEADTASEDTAA